MIKMLKFVLSSTYKQSPDYIRDLYLELSKFIFLCQKQVISMWVDLSCMFLCCLSLRDVNGRESECLPSIGYFSWP